MGKTYFACSDIHSFYTPFRTALRQAGFRLNNPDHILIICGDLFDRGHETKEMLNFVLRFPKDRLILIRGNHEDLYEQMILSNDIDGTDVRNGTARTFISAVNYGVVNKLNKLILDHSKWVNYYEVGNYVFTHSYVPRGGDDYKNCTDFEWSRARWGLNYLIHDEMGGARRINANKTLVCGHCSTAEWRYKSNRLDWYNLEPGDFDTFWGDRIIALDACTIISGKVNVVKLKID